MKTRQNWGPALVALFVAGCSALFPPNLSAQSSCAACHGELELLRQHVPTLPEARSVFVTDLEVRGSAHGDLTCTECHSGYPRFPHSSVTATKSCTDCHEEAADEMRGGIHALDDNADCADCHGIHDVATVASLDTPEGVLAMRTACASCHFEPQIPPDDPHADSVSCVGCHEPHRMLPPSDPESSVHVLNQAATCGTCHDTVSVRWSDDAHAAAVPTLALGIGEKPDGATGTDPPGCTGCHRAHGMLAPSHARFDQDMVERCTRCHEDYSETYFGTYHGKATALGSEIVATCDHCHGSHAILPASDPRSTVAPENLVETCSACHERARASFVLYDSHPNPMDRNRNAPLFYSFVFMNAMLFSVLGVFVLHTLLWWIRLLIDQQKGVVHGPGGDHV